MRICLDKQPRFPRRKAFRGRKAPTGLWCKVSRTMRDMPFHYAQRTEMSQIANLLGEMILTGK